MKIIHKKMKIISSYILINFIIELKFNWEWKILAKLEWFMDRKISIKHAWRMNAIF